MAKSLLLGSAVTGAKFTPRNHAKTGDSFTDLVSRGQTIKSDIDELGAEATALFEIGCRYYHYHARNPETHEQTTDTTVYQQVSKRVQTVAPGMLLSFGASRNGVEVREAISEYGEWERISQANVPLHLGGAHFVTKQAAVELQIILDMQKQGHCITTEAASTGRFVSVVNNYAPDASRVDASLKTNSSTNGANYGSTSPFTQFETYKRAVQSRRNLFLLHEIEWVQMERSYAMTRFATEHTEIGLGSSGQLNITLLFGFSPLLPFPRNYDAFRDVVRLAKSLEYNLAGERVRNITISVGAAVIPQHAERYFTPLDIGPRAGELACALRRLATYAAQPNSEVDVLRSGMEDTPYVMNDDGSINVSDNAGLLSLSRRVAEEAGAEIVTNIDQARSRMQIDLVEQQLATDERVTSQLLEA